jgi:hypothetical protein
MMALVDGYLNIFWNWIDSGEWKTLRGITYYLYRSVTLRCRWTLHLPRQDSPYFWGSAMNFGLKRFQDIDHQHQTHSIISWPFNSREVLDSRLGGSVPRVLWFFLWIFWDKIDGDFRLTVSLNLWFDLRLRGYIPYGMRLFESHYPYGFLMQDIKTSRVFLKTFEGRTRGRLGTTREDFKTTQDLLEYIPASSWFKYFWELRACRTRGWLGTTHRGHQDYLKPSHSTTKYSRACCTDIPGPPWRQVQPDY